MMTTKYELSAEFEQTLRQFQVKQLMLATDYDRSVLTTGSISCKKGCSQCCYYPVLSSTLESLLIYRSIVKHRLWTNSLKKAFDEHSNRVRGLNLEVWMLSKIPCPLLNISTGTCKIYKDRPFPCHTIYSRADPYYCDPAHSGGMPVLVPRNALLNEVSEMESDCLIQHQIGRIILPMSTAVLFAEKLEKGEINFSSLGVLVWQDYIQEG
jgi:Fe-S-cluster containining protein